MSIKKQLLSNIKNYKFNSIFIRNLIIIFCVIALFTSATTFFVYRFSMSNITEYTYQSNEEMCSTIKDTTDNLVSEMFTLAINVSLSSNVQDVMLFPDNVTKNSANITEYIGDFIYLYDYLDSMYVYVDANHKVVTSQRVFDDTEDEIDMDWYENYKSAKNDAPQIVFRAYKNKYPYYLTIIKPVYVANKNAGAIVLNIDIKKMCRVYKSVNRSSQQHITIVNDNGIIIYNEDNSVMFKRPEDNPITALLTNVDAHQTTTVDAGKTNNVISRVDSDSYNWSYYSSVPLDFYGKSYQSLMLMLIVMLVVSFLLSIFLSGYISLKIFRPMENIMEALDSPTPWKSIQKRRKENETDYILSRIESMRQSNTELTKEQENRLMVLKNAQTMMLQLQINPHFLGNTLNVINWMAIEMTMSENDVSKAIGKLAKLFKSYSDAADYMTDFKSEVEFAKQYTDILKLRYADTFNMQWNIEEKSLDAKLPRLVLQPIIENAVYHGIRPLDKEGTVTITSFVKNSIFNLIVEDNGNGIDGEKLEKMNEELLSETIIYDGHIGLKNVNQRFKLIYGNEYGIKLEKSENGGLKVVIRIPYVY